MTRISSVRLNGGERVPFANHTAYCVGTGRVSLALHEEYQKQLRRVQDLCHFRYIRGHGLFSDQLGIYQERKTPDGQVRVEYCFTYLDRVVDAWQNCGLRPFLELGFMPKALASGTQTIFYWNGHVTLPKDMKAWTDLVQATLRHLCERYGIEEVSTWPCEIWNEPNLKGFWENADKEKYLELYRATALAVKEAVPQMRVGGPAICGGVPGMDPGFPHLLPGQPSAGRFCQPSRLHGPNPGAPGPVSVPQDVPGGGHGGGDARFPRHHRLLPGVQRPADVHHRIQHLL